MATNNLSIILDLKDNASKELQNFSGRLEGLQSTFRKMAAVGTVALAGIAVGVYKATQEAAKAEGSWNKFNTVFGEGADDMRAWIGTVRKEMPTATHEIARMSADLQDLLIPMGLSRGVAQGMTKEMVTLANKLAAFNDVDPTQVLEAFKSGLAGSSEPLRRFGINALDSSIELEALQTGLLKAGQGFKDLDPITRSQVRAQAMVSLAYKQSGDAIAGFESNNDSLIRRQQALKATFAEMSVTIGNIFLPTLDSLVKKILPVVQAIGSWVEANPILARNIIIVSVALTGLVTVVGLLGIALFAMKMFLGSTIVLLALANLPILGIIAGIGLLVTALYFLYKNWGTIVVFVKDLFIGLGNFFANWWTNFTESTEAWLLGLKSSFIKNLEDIKIFFINWWSGLSDATQGWLLLIGNILTLGLLYWGMLFIKNFESIKLSIEEFFSNVKGGITIVVDFITGKLLSLALAFSVHFDAIKATTISVFTSVRDFFSTIWDSITEIFKVAIDHIMRMLRPLLRAMEIVGGGIGGGIKNISKGIGSGLGGLFNTGGNFFKGALSVNDAIISPDGNIITTHPDDYLIATKNPQSLGGGGGVVINITGNSFMGEDDMAEKIGNRLMNIVKLNAQV